MGGKNPLFKKLNSDRLTVDKPASSRLGDEQVGWTPAADQNEAGGLLVCGTWKVQCNEHRSHSAKG